MLSHGLGLCLVESNPLKHGTAPLERPKRRVRLNLFRSPRDFSSNFVLFLEVLPNSRHSLRFDRNYGGVVSKDRRTK